jgi:hypothetical protein
MTNTLPLTTCGFRNAGQVAVVRLDLGVDTPLGGSLTVSTCGLSTADTMLYVGAGCPGSDASWGCLGVSDDACGSQSMLTIKASARVVFVVVGGYSGAAASGVSWSYAPLPSPSSVPAALAAVNVRLPGGPASRGGSASHAASAGVANVVSAVAAAAGVDAGRVRVARLIEEATGWAVALPLAADVRLSAGGQRQLQVAPAAATPLAGPPLGATQEAAWRYVVAVSLSAESPPLGGGAAATPPLSAASLADRLADSAAALVWDALAATWAAATGQATSDVQARLAVSVSPPSGAGAAAPDGARTLDAAIIGGSVAGAVVLLALLAACGYAAFTRQRSKFRTGLDLPTAAAGGAPVPAAAPEAGGATVPVAGGAPAAAAATGDATVPVAGGAPAAAPRVGGAPGRGAQPDVI